MPFVSASIYQKAKRLALSEGLPDAYFEQHQHIAELKKGDKYIPIEPLGDVYEWANENLDEGFSVRQGKQLDSDDYGTLGLSWRTCWKAREVLDRLERFMVLVTDHGSIRMEERDGIITLIIVRDAHRVGIEIANEVSFVMITGILNEVTGKKIRPVKVTFKHAPRAQASLEYFFECPVTFGQPHHSIQFRISDIDVHTIKADKSIHQFLVERMDEEKRGIHASADRLLGEIHKMIEESLPSGIPSVIQVAEHLGMSARTLKRRLADKGLSFRDYVQKVQQETAVDLIRNSNCTMAEIAFQTGFSEQSAFNRAFKRWIGSSPVEYRKTL